ncbi:DUF3082 domain-containing protein [Merismopedia glauca]|uniref:DUF3082 domain-containing protein n=1 Tax=Merismopedia glauca CCAP 1448/3 TaxID=1296344 RepID=A0A2T1C5J9_9CYAN|nr:DUF3082 domain-containing protein [Merismopedia glauca]PSB03504.1 DUF3082 domain-containing protein [Merismopedia glauca CCAP 1448/3]
MSQTPIQPETSNNAEKVTPVRSLIGAVISGSMATALYFLTANIANNLASKPLPTGSTTTINIAVAVRTLVLGVVALGTFVFALVAFGLLALTVQMLWQRSK